MGDDSAYPRGSVPWSSHGALIYLVYANDID